MKRGILASVLERAIGARLWHSKLGVAGIFLVGSMLILTFFAPLIQTHPPSELSLSLLEPPSCQHYLGTDSYGRDVFSRIVMGSRESLSLALGALTIGFLGGSIGGLLAGYFGGVVDITISRFVDVVMSFPSIMIALFVVAIFGTAGKLPIMIAIGLALLPRFARVIRGSTLPIRQREYILAARAISASHLRIILRHIVPNLAGTLTVLCTIYFPLVILLEASLSFLGLGPPPDIPTWGRIIADGRPYLRLAPWVSVCPGIAIFITVIGFNLIGDGLRDLLDPKVASKLTYKRR